MQKKKDMFEITEPSALESLIATGIPVSIAVFQTAINSFNVNGEAGEPEHALYNTESKPKLSRIAEMYYTPHGLICVQKKGTVLIPLANVKYARVK